jgi:coenzyme F420-dependent glucose-6-phosphate dehydrogenase
LGVLQLGYALSSEEHSPRALVENAARAEGAGFSFALISDHFHPWVDAQGSSPFVWSVLGGIACATEDLVVGTGVTCPLIRTHPVVIAQAAATVASMMPGRFFLGVGTGENLNEHVTGKRWPAIDQRLEMLEEAIGVIRELWTGSDVTVRGKHYTVEQARIYTRPDPLPPIHMAASGERAAELAARIADGLIGTSPDEELVDAFTTNAGTGKPRYGQVTVCWASDETEAKRIAHEWWPNAAIGGELGQELPLPRHFEQAAKNVTLDDVAKVVTCGPDVDAHIAAIDRFASAGYDHVYIHQVGPEQEGFFRFYEERIIPEFRARTAA